MVKIRDKQQLLLSSDACVFRQQLSTVLECMREELDDHRLSINDNTTEVASSFDYLNEMNKKLDRLTERVDELTLLVKGAKEEPKFVFEPLTSKEKEVFLALYALTETQPFASYEQIARKCLSTKDAIASSVANMLQKGVPILKKTDSSTVFVKLDSEFRVMQAKKNLVGLNAPLTCWFS